MKIFVHIANGFVTTDPNAMIEVECDGVPRKGDLFYISDEQERDLENQIIKRGGYGDDWTYMKGTPSEEFSIADAIYVQYVSWERDERGVFRCHIELYDGLSDD